MKKWEQVKRAALHPWSLMSGLIVAAIFGIVVIRKADSDHYIGSQCDYCITFSSTNEPDAGLTREDGFLTFGSQSIPRENQVDRYMKKMVEQVSAGSL